MWLFLRNTLARDQVTSIGTGRQAQFKRKSQMGIAAGAIALGSAIVVLATPAASGAVSKTLGHTAAAVPNGFAVKRTLIDAQPFALDTPGQLHAADPSLVSVMHAVSDGASKVTVLRSELQARPPAVLSLAEPVLVSMCRVNPSICLPLAPAGDASSTHDTMHEWTGRITGGSVSAPAQRVTTGGGPLADAAPLVLPPALPDTHAGSYAGQIKGSLRNAWTAVGLPADLAAQVDRIFAGRLDATKPAQAGDSYRIVYEQDGRDQSGAPRRRVSAVEIRLAGQTYRAVWFVVPGRTTGEYYSFDGERLVAQPFAMPVNYARISSPFGYRIHPVTGLRLLHTGVDLTAAVGTPVVAAAAGVVQFVGFDSGYGNHVVLRHAQGYTSYYAHLSSFANGLQVGAHVSQGQRLGAVGQTGVATGPHLHFEVRVNNRPTDPLALTSRTGATLLTGSQRAAFDRVAGDAREQLAALSTSTEIRTASNTPPARF